MITLEQPVYFIKLLQNGPTSNEVRAHMVCYQADIKYDFTML